MDAQACKIKWCPDPYIPGRRGGQGWCGQHYQSWRIHGDPLAARRRKDLTVEGRFRAFVDRDGPTIYPHLSPCHLFTGHLIRGGYGWFKIDGEQVLAHRVAWMLSYGPIPADKYVLHRCDNRACVNINHLRLGTRLDNTTDMITRGRQARGERQHLSRLTEDKVKEIRRIGRPGRGGLTEQEIADMFGVSKATIGAVLRRTTWKHV